MELKVLPATDYIGDAPSHDKALHRGRQIRDRDTVAGLDPADRGSRRSAGGPQRIIEDTATSARKPRLAPG